MPSRPHSTSQNHETEDSQLMPATTTARLRLSTAVALEGFMTARPCACRWALDATLSGFADCAPRLDVVERPLSVRSAPTAKQSRHTFPSTLHTPTFPRLSYQEGSVFQGLQDGKPAHRAAERAP